MSIYIGNQTAFFTADPEEPFSYALEHGFTAFEWFADKKFYDDGGSSGWSYDDVSAQRAVQLRQISSKTGIRFSIHASCVATPLTDSGIKDIFKAIELAEDIDAKLVNIHLDKTSGIEAFVRQLVPAISATAARGIQLAIENTPLHAPEDFNELFTELEKLDNPVTHVGMCIDIGHANCCEATRNDYIGFIDRLRSDVRIIHAHVHENWGDKDSHLPLFTAAAAKDDTGVRLFIERLRQRGYTGSLIMEQWPDDRDILANIFNRLCDILGLDKVSYQWDSSEDVGEAGSENEIREALDTVVAEGRVSEPVTDTSEVSYQQLKSEIDQSSSWALKEIISFSETSKSWRRRLEGVRDLFFSSRRLQDEDLAAIAVYLRFLATGEIVCEEDGGHYRPCHHAQTALEIEDAISALKNEENFWILRKIYPYLPSHAEEFMRHEPLTRIRDIAHRNDIPKELKLDIKHNLQNKLHRSAGPEDLITAGRILAQITEDTAAYSPDFVAEFKTFYAELEEFFNAVGLEKRLMLIAEEFPELKGAIEAFLSGKTASDPLLRAGHAYKVRAELRKFTSGKKLHLHSTLLLADIELEDYAFATVSETINDLEIVDTVDKRGVEIITTSLQHMVLSGFAERETACILSEMTSWSKSVLTSDTKRLDWLRFLASLQRGLRLCASFADTVNNKFAESAMVLGHAFNIPEHAIAVYCEGDIRANIIFQFSRIIQRAQRLLKQQLGLPPWSIVTGGVAEGILVRAESLAEFEGRDGAFVVLLSKAEGDEEIPAAVRGVLLAHQIPHLSHLGVRSRSGRIPFAAADSIADFAEFQDYLDKEISLTFDQNGIQRNSVITGVVIAEVESVSIPDIELSSEICACSVEDISIKTCGNKAGVSAEMYRLSGDFEDFEAPRVMSIPYGVFELCLEEMAQLKVEYDTAVDALGSEVTDVTDDKLDNIVKIIEKIELPAAVIEPVKKYFGADTLLAVRSSSSGEDLAGFAGAGLYSSIIGVKGAGIAEAVKTVWASKWTRRAVLSRMKYKIAHDKLCMGVLLQEMVRPDFSFVLHTANPLTGKSGDMSFELAAGFGETLVSAEQAGSPCRINVSEEGKHIEILQCADISRALVFSEVIEKMDSEIIDYSAFEPFLGDNLYQVAEHLWKVGSSLERHFGTPQDVEGVFTGTTCFVVQSRAQAGIGR